MEFERTNGDTVPIDDPSVKAMAALGKAARFAKKRGQGVAYEPNSSPGLLTIEKTGEHHAHLNLDEAIASVTKVYCPARQGLLR